MSKIEKQKPPKYDLLTFDQNIDVANAPACDLCAVGQDALLFVLDILDTVSGIATSARAHHAVLLAWFQTFVNWNHLSCSNAGLIGLCS